MINQMDTHAAELRLLSIALELKKLTDSNNQFDAEPILEQYERLRKKLMQLDKEASDYLPETRFSAYDYVGKSMMKAKSAVQSLVAYLDPKIARDSGSKPDYQLSNLHPRLRKQCESLFISKHYSEAIFEGYKLLGKAVRDKSGLTGDGKSLMSDAFSIRNPVIILNNLQSETDRNEQEGFMHLFMGAMQGIRNPEAHEIRDLKDPIMTLEYLALASLLLRKLDEGKVLDTKAEPTGKAVLTGYVGTPSGKRQLPLELIDRVYTPLVKEVTTWRDDPTRADFSQWKRLNLEERYWVKRVPSQIAKRFEEAGVLFEGISQLRLNVQTLISSSINESFADAWLVKAGFPKEEGLGNVDFRVVLDENPVVAIYLSWLWESGKSLKDYIEMIAGRQSNPKTKLALQTTIFSRKSGTGKIVAGNDDTYSSIEKILDVLESQQSAKDLLRKLEKVKELGKEILAAIDEEFKS
jgi:uncharacterized protein (TIGR02391 family)